MSYLFPGVVNRMAVFCYEKFLELANRKTITNSPHNSNFTAPRGLRNLGNTCFLNSVLQALCACGLYVSFLKNLAIDSDQDEETFAVILARCLEDVRRGSSRSPVNPRKLFNRLTENYDAFAGHDQQDAYEAFQSISSMVAKEHDGEQEGEGLKSLFEKKGVGILSKGNNGGGRFIQRLCGWGQERMSFDEKRNPFEGWYERQLECMSCRNKKVVRHEPFMEITLSAQPSLSSSSSGLRKGVLGDANVTTNLKGGQKLDTASSLSVKSMLSEKVNGVGLRRDLSSLSDNTMSLYDCLDDYFNEEVVEGVECPACSQTETASKLQQKQSVYMRSKNVSLGKTEEQCLQCTQKAVAAAQVRGKKDALVLDLDPEAQDVLCRSAALGALNSEAGNNLTPMSFLSFNQYLIHRVRPAAKKWTRLSRLPKLLCFHLNRRCFDELNPRMRKVNTHIHFPIELDMSRYMTSNRDNGSQSLSSSLLGLPSKIASASANLGVQFLFTLRAVIVHHGSADSGHYSTYGRVEGGMEAAHKRNWMYFSDDRTCPVSEDEVMKSQAYMLFYSRI
jgi:ubiquitin C-terminal hydrolase